METQGETMATIRQEPNGHKAILVVCADRKRRTIRIGKASMKTANTVKGHIERLNTAIITGTSIDNEQALWLAKLGDQLHDRIARTGLCAPRKKPDATTLEQWCERYLTSHNVKASTIEQLEQARDNLIDYFKANRLLQSITLQDAKEWRQWLATSGNQRTKGDDKSLAENTVRRRTGRAKQIFQAAMDSKLIPENPFDHKDLPCATGENKDRMVMVSAADIEKCIDSAPSIDWRIIIALARYGGLRIPSELVQLKWDDVNWQDSSITINSPKTEHHKDGGVRQMPILPDLLPHLRAAWEAAPEGAVYVVQDPDKRAIRVNLATNFRRIIKKAGLLPWEKLWQNLRASRETELMAEYPIKDVCGWIGNSPDVANKHYAMSQAEHFKRAIAEGVRKKSGTESGTATSRK
jgi:integrase